MGENCIDIGEAAGYIYRLIESSEKNLSGIKNNLKENGYDAQTAFMAMGWLAREDKICMDKNGNSWSIRLK